MQMVNFSNFGARLTEIFRPDPRTDIEKVLSMCGSAVEREARQEGTIRVLTEALSASIAMERLHVRDERENADELAEAIMMAGAGPWRMPGAEHGKQGITKLKESDAGLMPYASAQGAYGDMELALQNLEWRREINNSFLEFSRWGIQQVILMSRLSYIKNPTIQRGVNVSAMYVFGRGVEVTTDNDAANEVLKEFWERNKKTLGQVALTELEKRTWYDGNIFYEFWADEVNSGKVSIRTIDATEIADIVTNPDDVDQAWFYRRTWVRRKFSVETGSYENETMQAWYPALGYDPADKPDAINSVPVEWEHPVYHRAYGGVAKWRFGCPQVYAALPWARAGKRFLEDCMTIRNALAQFAMIVQTKGGQQALAGIKDQLSTTVGPSAQIWDQNPPTTAGGIAAFGTGTELKAFNTAGAGGDPADVRQYDLMVYRVFGLPESFFADMNTSNLATATSLDRPTELGFMARQEAWREDFTVICRYVLSKSARATSGTMREALKKADKAPNDLQVREAVKLKNDRGEVSYRMDQTQDKDPAVVQIMVNFPSIIEADVPAMITAIAASAMVDGSGNFQGIDQKECTRLLYAQLGVDNAEDLLKLMYPDSGPDKYDPVRKKPEPMEEADPAAEKKEPKAKVREAFTGLRNTVSKLSRALRLLEAQEDDDAG